MQKIKISIAQSSSTSNVEENFAFCAKYMALSAQENTDLLVFPENILCWAPSEMTKKTAQPLDYWLKMLTSQSKEYKLNIVWGGVPVLEDGKIFNTSIVIGKDGKLLGTYKKIHLFQLFVKNGPSLDECQTYSHGDGELLTIDINGWKIGITICFDLRFPELYRQYAGCHAMICTAAFTRHTGRAHWELLLKARAVENQCYIIGADQCGLNEENKQHSHGHSMMIDPWGNILAEAASEPVLISAELDKDYLESIREKIPVLKSRRL